MKVRYTKRAAQQIEAALAYIRDRSPQGAHSVRRRLLEMLTILQHQPRIGHETSRRGVLRIGILPYPYLIDYRVTEDEIIVQRFRHAARRPSA